MDALSYKTVSVNKAQADKQWVLVDAEGQSLGRMASKVAKLIRGKHKVSFSPNADCGDNVIIINATKVALTGRKWDDKEYVSHTGYPGGQKFVSSLELFQKSPIKLIEASVRGMLPKNRLGRELFRNLHVFEGTEHPHGAQQPTVINLNDFK